MPVLPLCGLRRQEGAQRRAVFRRGIFPICLDWVPAVAQPLFVGVAILRNQSGDALWMTQRQSKAHRCTVVEDVESVPDKAEDLGKALHDLSQMIESVFLFSAIRRLREAETWQV